MWRKRATWMETEITVIWFLLFCSALPGYPYHQFRILWFDHCCFLVQVTHSLHQLNLTTYLTPAIVRFLHGPASWAIVLWTPCLQLCRMNGVLPRPWHFLNLPEHWKKQSSPQERETMGSLVLGNKLLVCIIPKTQVKCSLQTMLFSWNLNPSFSVWDVLSLH